MDPEQRVKHAEEATERGRLQAALDQAEQERDRLAAEVGRWVTLPWWRRLFAQRPVAAKAAFLNTPSRLACVTEL